MFGIAQNRSPEKKTCQLTLAVKTINMFARDYMPEALLLKKANNETGKEIFMHNFTCWSFVNKLWKVHMVLFIRLLPFQALLQAATGKRKHVQQPLYGAEQINVPEVKR